MCADCNHEAWAEGIEEMLSSGDFDWSDRLQDIGDWVVDNEHITDAQKIAVQNIAAKGEFYGLPDEKPKKRKRRFGG